MVVQDRIGETKSTEFNTMYAYKIKFNWGTMSFGMQAGFTRYVLDPAKLTIRDNGDPSFNPIRVTNFNVGSGLLFKGDQWQAGISVPRMLPASVSQFGTTIKLYDQHAYVFGSYAFPSGEVQASVRRRCFVWRRVAACRLTLARAWSLKKITRRFIYSRISIPTE